jgi:hypothetical protein
VVGLDAHGNIMHEVQPGDTLGDIALIYGYTWDDIPYMMQLNGLTNPRDLDIGSILLVPPYGGTYTPTPGEAATGATVEPTPSPPENSPTASATAAPSLTPVPTQPPTSVSAIDTATPGGALVAAAPTTGSSQPGIAAAGGTITQSGPSPWLTIALVVQVGVLVVAGLEYVLRGRRKR